MFVFLYNVLGISSRIKSEAVLMQSKLFKNEGLLPLTHCCKCVCSCASRCKFVCTVFVCTSLCYSSNLFISVCNYWLSIAGVFSRYRSTRSLFSNHFVPYPNECPERLSDNVLKIEAVIILYNAQSDHYLILRYNRFIRCLSLQESSRFFWLSI